MRGRGRSRKGQAEAAPVVGHVPKAQQQGQDVAAARFEILEGLFKLGPVFFRGGRDFCRGFGDSALELGGRIGMDGDGRVAEHRLGAVVATTTNSGSPALGSMTG